MTAEVNDCVTLVDYCKARTTKCFLQPRVFQILHEIGRLREVTLEK
jgi:hypothetical protein